MGRIRRPEPLPIPGREYNRQRAELSLDGHPPYQPRAGSWVAEREQAEKAQRADIEWLRSIGPKARKGELEKRKAAAFAAYDRRRAESDIALAVRIALLGTLPFAIAAGWIPSKRGYGGRKPGAGGAFTKYMSYQFYASRAPGVGSRKTITPCRSRVAVILSSVDCTVVGYLSPRDSQYRHASGLKPASIASLAWVRPAKALAALNCRDETRSP
jgi:hypothetical protein